MKSFFISSTFRDMQEERDTIHRIVFPSLRNTLKKYGETAEEVDLRWGVDTLNLSEEDSGNMVIKVCIDAIDRCVPYFIVLLGERYGWIPEEGLFDKLHDERFSQFKRDISITELEIQYGALSRDIGLDQCIFCFRNASLLEQIPEKLRKDYMAESVIHKEKLEQLKATIRSLEGANILEYEASWDDESQKVCGLSVFAKRLEEMLIELLQKDGLNKEPVAEEEQISRNAEFTMQQYLNTYINREKAENLLPILYASGKSIWVLGESGIGKTSFLSFAANQCRQKNMTTCVYYGGNPGCQSVDTFLGWLSFELEKICGKKLKEDNRTKRIAVKKIKNLAKHLTQPVMVFVDAVDQMKGDIVWTLCHLSNNTSKLRFFVSSSVQLWEKYSELTEDLFATRSLSKLTDTEIRLMVSKAARCRGKSLDAKVTKKILAKGSMHLPIHLSLLMQRLFMMDGAEFAQAEKLAPGMEGISQYMQSLVEESGDTADELLASVVNKAMQIMEGEGGKNIRMLLGFLAAAPEGICLRELSELCLEVSMLQIQQMLFFLYDLVEEAGDGRWGYKHPFYAKAICNILGEDNIRFYEEQLFERWKNSRVFRWSEYIYLGKKLGRKELPGEISKALENDFLSEEQVWNECGLLPFSGNPEEERYIRCMLRGIAKGELNWTEDVFLFLKDLEKLNMVYEDAIYCFCGAKYCMYDVLSDFGKKDECADKQYQIFSKMENVNTELFWDFIELCVNGCCDSDSEQRKLWYQRLSEVERRYYPLYKESDFFLLMNSILVWYKKFCDYKESGNEEDLEELKKFFEANRVIYEAQDGVNLYEQQKPGYNAKCMEILAVFARNLATIYINNKQFASAYPYAQIAYTEAKKAYQLHRTQKTADLFSWAAINITRCMKEESELRNKYSQEAQLTLDWMESNYFTPKVGEWKRYLYSLNSDEKNALAISRRLRDQYPDASYDESVLYDCRKYKDVLKRSQEHARYDEIREILDEIYEISNRLYARTKDGYFLDVLNEWALDMMQTYTWQEMYDEAEEHLHLAEKYLSCDYIQKSRFRWHREMITATNGLTFYYRKGEKAKSVEYILKAEILFADEEEKNKNRSRQETAILWSGRIHYMKTRMLWEETHDLAATHTMLDKYFEQYGSVVDENELRPARFLLAELKAFEGEAGSAVIELKKCRMRGSQNMGWQTELQLSEYEVWQFLIAAKASLLIYDLEESKEQVYLNAGIRALYSIVSYHTRDGNAFFRQTAGCLLAEYFMKYRRQASAAVEMDAAKALLKWMQFESERRSLEKSEKELVGECLLYRAFFEAKDWSEEDEKAKEWLICQKQTYPEDISWNDRVNRFMVKKVLWHCIHDEYEQALTLCDSIPYGYCESWNKECEILSAVCRIQTETAVSDLEMLEMFCADADEQKRTGDNTFWVRLEVLYALEKYRETARMIERKFRDTKREIPEFWRRDYKLRKACFECSQLQADKSVYLEDLKALRMAWAYISGYEKESTVRLLELDGKIARAYEGTDEKLEWKQWETVCLIMKSNLIKKDLLNVSELEEAVSFYQMLLQKMELSDKWRYYTVGELLEVAMESMTRLYDLTGNTAWLEKAFDATSMYRTQINHPKLDENRNDFRKEKVAESYLQDMDLYQIYLENGMEDQILDKMTETIKVWISCIPDYYKELVTAATGIIKEIDEYLEGRSLEIKALGQTMEMRQDGDSNEIFWFIRGLYEKHGTKLTLDELKELYAKEQNR